MIRAVLLLVAGLLFGFCGPAAAQTTLFLQDTGAGFTGYNLAGRYKVAGSILTATVNTAGSGTDIQWTTTAGGATISFASRPFTGAITIAGTVTINIWTAESSASANAGLRVKLSRLQADGTKTLFATLDKGTEMTTGAVAQNYTGAPTSTAFVKGDRLVIEPFITNIGTMGGGFTCSFTYNRANSGATGDSFVTLTETLPLNAGVGFR